MPLRNPDHPAIESEDRPLLTNLRTPGKIGAYGGDLRTPIEFTELPPALPEAAADNNLGTAGWVRQKWAEKEAHYEEQQAEYNAIIARARQLEEAGTRISLDELDEIFKKRNIYGLKPPEMPKHWLEILNKEDEKKSRIKEVDPSKWTPKTLQEFYETGDYSKLKPREDVGGARKIGATKEAIIFKIAEGGFEGLSENEQEAWNLLSQEDKLIGQATLTLIGKDKLFPLATEEVKTQKIEAAEKTIREIFGAGEDENPELPPASENKGRTGTVTETGKRFKSDGIKWIEVK